MPLTELMAKQAKAQDKPYVPPRWLPRLSVFPAYPPAEILSASGSPRKPPHDRASPPRRSNYQIGRASCRERV